MPWQIYEVYSDHSKKILSSTSRRYCIKLANTTPRSLPVLFLIFPKFARCCFMKTCHMKHHASADICNSSWLNQVPSDALILSHFFRFFRLITLIYWSDAMRILPNITTQFNKPMAEKNLGSMGGGSEFFSCGTKCVLTWVRATFFSHSKYVFRLL